MIRSTGTTFVQMPPCVSRRTRQRPCWSVRKIVGYAPSRHGIADRGTGMGREVRPVELRLRAGVQDEVLAHPAAAAGEHWPGEDAGGDRGRREDAKRFHDVLLPGVKAAPSVFLPPPQVISERPVQTAVGSRRPTSGACGSGDQLFVRGS
jgi:hypothetical protein